MGSAEKSGSSEDSDMFEEPQILPRVGAQYQVKVPSLIRVSEYLRLSNSLAEAEITFGGPHNILMGMPIPLVWISEETENKKLEQHEAFKGCDDISNKNESPKSECIEITAKLKVEPIDMKSVNRTKLDESENLLLLENGTMAQLQPEHGGKGHLLVPGGLGDKWSNIEEASFLLGLYIFGKNLVVVKKFIESKQMGDILSYYYGRFYASETYQRWSELRKIKNRKCIIGQRIFTGLRHQELLSRLLPHVSEECKNTILEISKTFGEGKILREEYVFTLKATFGLNALVEAVGIGKGKQDLTGIALDTPRSNQVSHVRPEIPIGKACSTLTTPEIVNFLTGDFRLSKARSSDLFWEAVWPRLLAQGWHSEQPNNHGFTAGSRHSLVFLIPGIKKFSRRKLVKGEQYFDSVSDVLSKVASNPGLIEIESYKSKEENGWSDETKLYQEDFPNQQRHCYLKPRTPNCAADSMKVTVVDTSLANGKAFKMSELRSLPGEIMNTFTSLSDSDKDDGDSSDELADKSGYADNLCSDKGETNDLRSTMVDLRKTLPVGGNDFEYNASKESSTVNGPSLSTVPEKIFKENEADILNGIHQNKATDCKLIQKIVPENKNHVAPVAKRFWKTPPKRIEMRSHSTTNSRVDSRFQQEANSCINSSDFSENILSQEKLSWTNSSRGASPVTNFEGIANSNLMAAEQSHEKPPLHTLIDLNIPVSPDAEIDKTFMGDTAEGRDHPVSKEPDTSQAVKSPEDVANPQQEVKACSRRQSTRNRPLTTKVLEALAYGYLDTKQKRKTKDAFPGENARTRSSRRSRARVTPPESLNSVIVEQNGTTIQNGNGDVINNLGNGIYSQTG